MQGLNHYQPLSSTLYNGNFSDPQRTFRPSSREQKIKQYPLSQSESTQLDNYLRSSSKDQPKMNLDKSRDMQLSQMQADQNFYMKNALESKYRLKQRDSVEDENEKLRSKLRELQDREKNLQVLVENQKSQIMTLQKSGSKPLDHVQENRHSNHEDGPAYLPLNGDQKRNGFPDKKNGSLSARKPLNDHNNNDDVDNGFHQPEDLPQISARDNKLGRAVTPRGARQNQPLTNDFLNSLNQPSNYDSSLNRTMYPTLMGERGEENASLKQSIYSGSKAHLLELNTDEFIPEDVIENSTPDELRHFVKLLKKNSIIQDQQYKAEMENHQFQIQRLELNQVDKDQQIKHLQKDLEVTDSKLKDRDQELALVYEKLQTLQGRRQVPQLSLNGAQNAPGGVTPSRRNSNSQIALPGDTTSAVATARPPTPDGTQDNLRISTHGRLTRVTVWSNRDRVHGLTFQYIKDDGIFIQGSNSYFEKKNLQFDCFDLTQDDFLTHISGSFNINGVKSITLRSAKRAEQNFYPKLPTQDDREKTEYLIQNFEIPIINQENYLQIIFPNIFHYNMKGSQIEDKQDQNFFYSETNQIQSLQNPCFYPNRQVNPANPPREPPQINVNAVNTPPVTKPLEQQFPPYIQNGVNFNQNPPPKEPASLKPVEKMPERPPTPIRALADEYEQLRPRSHYFSDNFESYQIKEVIESGFNRANFSDADILFPEPVVKIFKIKIWSDENWVYGLQFSYLTPDGYSIIEGRYHVGIQNLSLPYDEIVIKEPDVYMKKMQYWKKPNSGIEKLVITLSSGVQKVTGQPAPSKEAKEFFIELDLFSYVYGSLFHNPESLTPGNIVLGGLKRGQRDEQPL